MSGSLGASVFSAIRKAIHKEPPPTIGVVGLSGVGKSSLINALFRTQLATSPTVACTKEFESVEIGVPIAESDAEKSGDVRRARVLRVIDAPGLGESMERDEGYLTRYREELPRADVVVWVLAARNRALSLDQYFLEKLRASNDRLLFCLNQADLVDPVNWNAKINLPSAAQKTHLQEIVADRGDKIARVLGQKVTIMPCSAKTGYRLQQLFTAILRHCPPSRKFLFSLLKNFDYRDFFPITVPSARPPSPKQRRSAP